jgi:hypothetical protein
MSEDERRLSKGDVEAIAEELISELMRRFYADLGKGLWQAARGIIVAGLIIVAAIGAKKGLL